MKIIKILCFGDSITKGYYGNGYCPYSKIVEQWLNESTDQVHFQLVEKGQDGECVVEMEERFKRALLCEKFDYVILLGGLNDLGCDTPITDIMDSFKVMYNLMDDNANETNVKKFFHITIPFNAFDTFSQEYQNKIKLNNMILEFKHVKRIIIDINHESFNYLCLDECDRKLYWDDHLHYTPKGYEMLAKIIFEKLIENIKF
ncbi:SGNH hydrolase-type esterase domain-containing protein [Cunninghamella echinulata]|nr:SGNH hydrolase-type esterase domain-containing protein [Cunninghamella echinulata]